MARVPVFRGHNYDDEVGELDVWGPEILDRLKRGEALELSAAIVTRPNGEKQIVEVSFMLPPRGEDA